jgi:hypothetical protein
MFLEHPCVTRIRLVTVSRTSKGIRTLTYTANPKCISLQGDLVLYPLSLLLAEQEHP